MVLISMNTNEESKFLPEDIIFLVNCIIWAGNNAIKTEGAFTDKVEIILKVRCFIFLFNKKTLL